MMQTEQKSLIRCYIAGPSGVQNVDRSEVAKLIRGAPVMLDAPGELPLVWIDILNPSEAEAAFLRDDLGMHHLAVEDCLRGRQRPKIDRYPGYFFLVFYAARMNVERKRMALNELHVFLGSTFLITVHNQEMPEIARHLESWHEDPSHYLDSGTAAHAILDTVTDNYFPITEHFSHRLAILETDVFTSELHSTLQRGILLRQEMILLRRVLAPERDVLSSLVLRDLPFVRPELIPYFTDVHDHIMRVIEELDSFRDLLTGLIEIQSSISANQLNRTMQALAGWSIILMSMSLIAGIYGMNFTFMPELDLRWGYFGALALMFGIGAGLLSLFRRRGWL